jgi:predicted DsbA family dithiol-disulfide isomerase
MSERRISIDVWSDIVCPWCFVGKRRLDRALAEFAHRDAVDVRWHAFELDPSAPRSHEGGYVERLARKYGTDTAAAQAMIARMVAVAADDGITLDFERARPGNTFDAHRLVHFAAGRVLQPALEERLFRATFTEGLPIGDRETLVGLAADVGLDEEQARAVVFSDAGADAVRADEAHAAELGIRGVPFFILDGKYAISGAQPAELLGEALEHVWREAGEAAAVTASGPACDADGCD